MNTGSHDSMSHMESNATRRLLRRRRRRRAAVPPPGPPATWQVAELFNKSAYINS